MIASRLDYALRLSNIEIGTNEQLLHHPSRPLSAVPAEHLHSQLSAQHALCTHSATKPTPRSRKYAHVSKYLLQLLLDGKPQRVAVPRVDKSARTLLTAREQPVSASFSASMLSVSCGIPGVFVSRLWEGVAGLAPRTRTVTCSSDE